MTLEERKQHLHQLIDELEDETLAIEVEAFIEEVLAPPLTDEQKAELDRRLANLDSTPTYTLQEVIAHIHQSHPKKQL